MKFSIFFFLIAINIQINAQDYFLKCIEYNVGNTTGRTILEYNERYYILSSHVCENIECSTLAEISIKGDTLWVRRLHDLDIERNSILIKDDTISISSNNPPFNNKYRLAHFDLNGNKLGKTLDIYHPNEVFNSMFHFNSVYFGDKIFITGTGWRNSIEYGLLYSVDSKGALDTLLMLEPQVKRSTMWEVEVDLDGNLMTYHAIEEVGFDKIRKVINKFDKDLNHIWRYQSEDSRNWEGGSVGVALEDGRVILVVYSDISSTSPHSSIRAINPDGSTDWQHDVSYSPFFSDGTAEIISKVKYLPSGDILCMGRYSNTMIDTPLHDVPFIYKMTTDGEVLWKRAFYSTDVGSDMSRNGIVRDVIELDNGDLYGIGRLRVDGQYETFIFKVNSDGCLDPDDCGLVHVITDVEKPSPHSHNIKIYPNPVEETIRYELAHPSDIELVSILDISGAVVMTISGGTETGQIDVTPLVTGVYVLRLRMTDGAEIYRRFLKG